MTSAPTTSYPLHTFFNTLKELDEFNDNLQKFMKGTCADGFEWYWCGTGSNGKTTLVKQLFPNAIQLSPIATGCKETYNYKDNKIIILNNDEVETERIRKSYKNSTDGLITYFSKKFTSAKEKEINDYILNNMFNKNQHEADIFSNLYKTFKDHKNHKKTSLADWAWIGDVEEMKHHIAVLFEKPFISLIDSSAKGCVYLYMYMGVRKYIFLQTPEQFTTRPKSTTVSHIPKQQKVAEPVKIPADIDNLITQFNYKEKVDETFGAILKRQYSERVDYFVKNHDDIQLSGCTTTLNCQLCFNQRKDSLYFSLGDKTFCNDCHDIIAKKIPKKTVEMTEKEYELFLKFKSQ